MTISDLNYEASSTNQRDCDKVSLRPVTGSVEYAPSLVHDDVWDSQAGFTVEFDAPKFNEEVLMRLIGDLHRSTHRRRTYIDHDPNISRHSTQEIVHPRRMKEMPAVYDIDAEDDAEELDSFLSELKVGE